MSSANNRPNPSPRLPDGMIDVEPVSTSDEGTLDHVWSSVTEAELEASVTELEQDGQQRTQPKREE